MAVDYVAIGNRVREKRKQAHLTQEQLAEKAGIEPSNLSHIERAATKVSLPTLIGIANALNVTLDELVYGSLVKTEPISNRQIEELLAECTPREQLLLAEWLRSSLALFRRFSE